MLGLLQSLTSDIGVGMFFIDVEIIEESNRLLVYRRWGF